MHTVQAAELKPNNASDIHQHARSGFSVSNNK